MINNKFYENWTMDTKVGFDRHTDRFLYNPPTSFVRVIKRYNIQYNCTVHDYVVDGNE